MAHDVCNYYFSLWAILCPFTPITDQKTKISENEKSTGDIIILHKSTKNHDHIGKLFLRYGAQCM